MVRFHAGVHGRRLREAPDRLTTASTRSISVKSMMRADGAQLYSFAAFGVPRTSLSTSWPPAVNCEATSVPIMPEAPAMSTFMR
jgi:hypothetical protein